MLKGNQFYKHSRTQLITKITIIKITIIKAMASTTNKDKDELSISLVTFRE